MILPNPTEATEGSNSHAILFRDKPFVQFKENVFAPDKFRITTKRNHANLLIQG